MPHQDLYGAPDGPAPVAVRAPVQAPGLSRGEWTVIGVGGAGLLAVGVAAVLAALDANPSGHLAIFAELLIAACALTVLLIMSVTLSQRLAVRVRMLREVAQELGGGDLGVRAPVESADDLGKLGQSLNVMADRIARVLQAQRDLLSGVSHELRSPLARIEVAIELIRMEFEDGRRNAPGGADRRKSQGEELVAEIQMEVGLLERHIERLLDAQRVGVDRVLVQRELVRVDELLGQILDREQHRLSHLGFAVERSLELYDGKVSGDPNALDRAFSTLIENVVQHAQHGGSARSVRMESRRDTMGVVVRVLDRGPGLAQEQCARVFEAFFRVDPSRTEQTGGTGLGLYLVKKISEAHGGTARAHPRAGGGLVIEVRLPLHGQRQAKETVKVQAVSGD
ncbi:MAG: HAMP domain-containing histidine kinase [Myxococcales bacterium]|nr:HAMP domain-containing histidine kinase [Myxococcales bacterium]